MKAVIKAKPVPGATLVDLPIPRPDSTDLLVKVGAAAICGTDIHVFEWTEYASSRIRLPLLFGHEFSGEVVDVGKDVKHIGKGDRVAAETHVPCGKCFQCATGLQHICRDMKILGVHMDGAFSEYAILPSVCAWKLDPSISYELGATMEPFGIAVHAISKTPLTGKKVLVFGCGPIGIYTQALAKFAGAEVVIAVDLAEERLDLSRKLGADVSLNGAGVDLPAEVNRLTNQRGADVVIEVTGNPSVVKDATNALRKGGTLILVGLFPGPVEIDLVNSIIYKEANVYGVTGRVMWETWWAAESILLSGRLDISPVITHRFDLEEYETALELAKSCNAGKILFKM